MEPPVLSNERLLVAREPSHEARLARQYAAETGLQVLETWTKALATRRVVVAPGDVAVGTIAFVRQRLRSGGIEPPAPNDYPEPVREFLRRDVRRMTLRDARDQIGHGGRRLFVKPADTLKRFTGFVAEHATDYRFNGAGANTRVWISDCVEFIAEWRAYCAYGKVLALSACPGSEMDAVSVSRADVDEIARRLHAMERGYDGVCFDVGVLANGSTALVEVNEGYGLGAYVGCTPEVLWRVHAARQHQLTGTLVGVAE